MKVVKLDSGFEVASHLVDITRVDLDNNPNQQMIVPSILC